VGAVRDSTGGWTWPIVVLLALTAAQVPAGWRAVTARRTTSP
jgi:cyanate permease